MAVYFKRRIGKVAYFCLFFLAVLLIISYSYSRAISVEHLIFVGSKPQGERVHGLAIDHTNPKNLYAITTHGVYRSVNGAESWTPANGGLSEANVYDIAIDRLSSPPRIYIATGHGIFRSATGGEQWHDVMSQGDQSPNAVKKNVYRVTLDPTNGDILYAVTNDGMFKTLDSGQSWHAVNTGLASFHIHALSIDPRSPTTLYAGTDSNGIFKTTNGGKTWQNIHVLGLADLSDLPIRALAIDPITPATLYAGTFGGLFRSKDAGVTWTRLNENLFTGSVFVETLAIDPVNPMTIYAGTLRGRFKTTDAAQRWFSIDTGFPERRSSVRAFAIDPKTPSTLYAGSEGSGIFKSTDAGASWRSANVGLEQAAY